MFCKTLKLTLLLPLLASLAFAQDTAALSQKASSLIESEIKKQGIVGLTSTIVIDSKVVFAKAFGSADLENRVPATTATVIRTGSLAKPLTAAAALKLAADGKLDLDAPVQKYCPALPEKQWPVTTRQLLGHLGGVRHYKADYSDYLSTNHYATLKDSFEQFAAEPLVVEPGTKFLYSSNGYTIIGCVIEGAAGKSFAAALEETVFKPAGMSATRVDGISEIIPGRSRPYSLAKSGVVENSPFVDTSNKIPGGGLVSTAEDLARFAIALQSNMLLDTASVKMMWTSQVAHDGNPTNYGVGWNVRDNNGLRIIEHGGTAVGATNEIWMVPEHGIAVIVMTNTDGVNARRIAQGLAEIYAPKVQPAKQQ